MSWLNPLPWWAWTALLLPLVIHWLFRRLPRVQPWAAMRLLRLAVRSERRKTRVQHLLFLLLRTAAVLSALLAFSAPVLDRAGLLPSALLGESKRVVLVLDVSAGMRVIDEDGVSRFEAARRQALAVLARLKSGDGVSLFVTPGERGADLSLLASGADLDAVKNTLLALAPGLRVSVPLELKRLVDPDVAHADRGYLFTDGEIPVPAPDAAEAAKKAPSSRVAALELREGWTVVLVGAAERENFRIRDIRLPWGACAPDRPLTFEVIIEQTAGPAGAEIPTGRARLGEGPWQNLADTAQPLPDRPHTWARRGTVMVGAPEFLALEVELQTRDMLPDDHRAFRAVPVRSHWTVVAVDGDPDGEPERGRFRGETAYAQLAVEAAAVDTALIPVQLHRIEVAELAETLERDPDVLVLANLTRLGGAEREPIERYLERGGALWITLGDQIAREPYTEWFSREQPCVLPALPAAASRQTEAPWQASVPGSMPGFWKDLTEGGKHEPFLSLTCSRFWPVEAHAEAQVLMALRADPNAGGLDAEPSAKPSAASTERAPDATTTPLLLAKPYHNGLVWLWATSFDSEWSNLPVWGLFPGFLAASFQHLAAHRYASLNADAQQPMRVLLPGRQWIAKARGKRPGETREATLALNTPANTAPSDGAAPPNRPLTLESSDHDLGFGSISWRHGSQDRDRMMLFARNFPAAEIPTRFEEKRQGPQERSAQDWQKLLGLERAPRLWGDHDRDVLDIEEGDPGRGARLFWWLLLAALAAELSITPFFQARRGASAPL